MLISRPAQVAVLLLAGLAALLVYLQNREMHPGRPVAIQKEPEAGDVNKPSRLEAPPREGAKSESGSSAGKPPEAPPNGSRSPRTPSNTNAGAERTRAPKSRVNPVTLSSVNHVYLNTGGDEPARRQLREALANGLTTIGHFSVVNTAEEADAMLEASDIQSLGGSKISVRLQLVSSQGQVLWPEKSIRYSGNPAEVAAQALKDLQAALSRAQEKR